MFPIVDVPPPARALNIETLGSKRKFWYQDPQLGRSLFKYRLRENVGDDWAEKVVAELARLLRLPHARYELASCGGEFGSVTPMFVPPGGRLVLGNEVLTKLVPNYPGARHDRQFQRVREHTLRRVLILTGNASVALPLNWSAPSAITSGADVFVGYLLLDAWVANQDRHDQNWGFVLSPTVQVHLAPTFDHGSSLARNETDKVRQRRLSATDSRQNMEAYVRRARSAVYAEHGPEHPLATVPAFGVAAHRHSDAAQYWLSQLEEISEEEVTHIFESIPRDRMTDTAAEFALRLLQLNKQRLLELPAELFR